ncbi:MAG: hypothetical protein J6S67_13020 [Methanobrevibacter sp.]|nr:hypothetical protein [Methanobrevibacter sp.]
MKLIIKEIRRKTNEVVGTWEHEYPDMESCEKAIEKLDKILSKKYHKFEYIIIYDVKPNQMKLSSSKVETLLEIINLMSESQRDIAHKIRDQEMTPRNVVDFENYMKDLIKRFMDVVEE